MLHIWDGYNVLSSFCTAFKIFFSHSQVFCITRIVGSSLPLGHANLTKIDMQKLFSLMKHNYHPNIVMFQFHMIKVEAVHVFSLGFAFKREGSAH